MRRAPSRPGPRQGRRRHSRACRPPSVEYFDDVVLIGVNANLAGDGQCLLDDIGGGELGMAQQRPRSGLCICTSRADGDDPVLGLENVAGAGNDQRRSIVGDGQHGFEPAQNSVGAPVLGQFDRRALQLSLVLVELRLEALKQRECVRGGARKTRQHSVVYEPAYLARGRLTTTLPSVTWPSPPSATLAPRRTDNMVVP